MTIYCVYDKNDIPILGGKRWKIQCYLDLQVCGHMAIV